MSQNNSVSCLPRRGSRCLGNVCGNSIDLEDVRFTANKSNLVYMDKVFSYNDATGCPLIVPICTCGENARFFKTTLTLCQNDCGCGCGCGCNCGCSTLDKNAQFTVENSFVLVDLFDIAPNGCIHPSQVTVDGFPVDSICQSGGQFSAATDDLIPRIQKERCIEAGLPTKTFFLVSGAGPWTLRVRFVLTGTVVSGGKCSSFRLEIESAPNQPNINLPVNRLSNFAISDLSLPCITKGIAPTIRFQFGANAQLQNPTLTVNCQPSQPGTPCESCSCSVCLNANMVIEPKIQVEVIRKTLFCVNACEALIPCQGSIEELLSEEDEECPNPFAPDCRCGSSGSVGGVSWDDGCGCGGNSWGPCSGSGCGSCGNNCGGCGSSSGSCGNNCGGCGSSSGSCGNNCGGCGSSSGSCGNNCGGCGSSSGSCGNNCGGCGGSCGSCGSCGGSCGSGGCGGDHHHNPGIQPRRSPDAFQLNGCNGCSW